jgi:hypothetical protein
LPAVPGGGKLNKRMTTPPQLGPPYKFIAGDSVQFLINNPQYPSANWSMSFVLSPRDGSEPDSFQGVAQTDQVSFLVTVAASQTETVLPESYASACVFSQAGPPPTRYTQLGQTIWVIPDLTKSLAQSPNQILLAALKAALLALGSGTDQNFSLGGANYSKKNLSQLQAQIYVTEAAVQDERDQLDRLLGRPPKTIVNAEFAPLLTQPGFESYPGGYYPGGYPFG